MSQSGMKMVDSLPTVLFCLAEYMSLVQCILFWREIPCKLFHCFVMVSTSGPARYNNNARFLAFAFMSRPTMHLLNLFSQSFQRTAIELWGLNCWIPAKFSTAIAIVCVQLYPRRQCCVFNLFYYFLLPLYLLTCLHTLSTSTLITSSPSFPDSHHSTTLLRCLSDE